MFRRVLEVEDWSSRALVNWGRAMAIRAELAEAPEVAEKLYEAAIKKFDAVLREEEANEANDPKAAVSMVTAKYRCALAMKALAALKAASPGGRPREVAQLLQDAVGYLEDVTASELPDAASLRGAAAEALEACLQEQAGISASGRRSA